MKILEGGASMEEVGLWGRTLGIRAQTDFLSAVCLPTRDAT